VFRSGGRMLLFRGDWGVWLGDGRVLGGGGGLVR